MERLLRNNVGDVWSHDKIKRLFDLRGGYGEGFEMMLAIGDTEKDLKPIGKCVIIPFPLFIEDEQGRKIEIQAVTPDADYFTIVGSGFAPKEKLIFKSRSCEETLDADFKVDGNGGFYMGYVPAVNWKKGKLFLRRRLAEKYAATETPTLLG